MKNKKIYYIDGDIYHPCKIINEKKLNNSILCIVELLDKDDLEINNEKPIMISKERLKTKYFQ